MSSWSNDKPAAKRGPGILNIIPGYKGYREKEARRDQDKQVRLELARHYDLLAQRIADLQGELVQAQRFAEIGNVERLERSLRLFTDRLRTATYGYGGLFSDRPVDEKALDQLAAFDNALGDGAEELKTAIEAIATAITSGEGLPQKVRAAQDQVTGLNRRFDLRSEAINSGTAPASTANEGAPNVFGTPGGQQTHVANDLHFGDAVAISGASYIVKGRMEFHGDKGAWRQYLLRDDTGDHWLHVPPSADEPMALLTQTTETLSEGPTATIGGKNYTQAAAGQATAEVVGEAGKQENRPVAFRRFSGDDRGIVYAYTWGSQQQVLAGRILDPLEIKVYGQ